MNTCCPILKKHLTLETRNTNLLRVSSTSVPKANGLFMRPHSIPSDLYDAWVRLDYCPFCGTVQGQGIV